MKKRGLNTKDAVIGIAASGRTLYTIGAVEYAKSLGCFTACITCVPDSEITRAVESAIVPIVGAEVIAGSSRMKAGTAQKMILNMISTAAMIRLGYVKGNRMTNMRSSNEKLRERSLRILMAETGLDETSAGNLLEEAYDDLRVALVMARSGADSLTATRCLEKNGFVVEKAIAIMKGEFRIPI